MKEWTGKAIFGNLLIFCLILAPFKAESAMSSTNYQIRFDELGTGGEDTSSSTTYKVRDTLGIVQGTSSSASYSTEEGFRAGIYDPVVAFSVLSTDRSSQVAATSLSGTTVNVTTSAGFAVGDMIVVVQDEGAGQTEAMGRITSLSPTSLTVDAFNTGISTPTINSVNDYVYILRSGSLSLSTFSDAYVATGNIGWEVNADVPDGYGVYVFEDGNLSSGDYSVPDVTDGTVSPGTSEYGGRSSDASLSASTFDTEDTKFTSTPQLVGSREDSSFASRDFLTLKAAVNAGQVDGSYSHTLTLIFVGNY
jgi:hypothetical protein